MMSRAKTALAGHVWACMATAMLLASASIAHADPASRATTPITTTPQDQTATPLSDSPTPGSRIWRQTGVASWYGGTKWNGKITASGVRYDQNKLTAAHATLPIGTQVRVQLEGSDRSVIVVINDRPGTRTRIIDLSRKAATELGILNQGIALVTLATL